MSLQLGKHLKEPKERLILKGKWLIIEEPWAEVLWHLCVSFQQCPHYPEPTWGPPFIFLSPLFQCCFFCEATPDLPRLTWRSFPQAPKLTSSLGGHLLLLADRHPHPFLVRWLAVAQISPPHFSLICGGGGSTKQGPCPLLATGQEWAPGGRVRVSLPWESEQRDPGLGL